MQICEFVIPTGLWTYALLFGIGFCGIGDQYLLTIALQYESAGPVSVTRTFNIVLSFLWEVLITIKVSKLVIFCQINQFSH